MTPENEATLRTRYPLVYGARFLNGEPFRCGDGWFDILDQLGAALSTEVGELPARDRGLYHAVQVKEKLGGLRVYLHTETPAMSEHIANAERKASVTCEVCGQPGTMQTVGLIKTVCAAHHLELLAKYRRPQP